MKPDPSVPLKIEEIERSARFACHRKRGSGGFGRGGKMAPTAEYLAKPLNRRAEENDGAGGGCPSPANAPHQRDTDLSCLDVQRRRIEDVAG